MDDILTSVDFWKIVIPALGAVGVWWLTERAKLKSEQFKRREEHYREMIKATRGFYAASEDAELKTAFLDQVNLLWLYTPDTVIQAAYRFLTEAERNVGGGEAERALSELMSLIREDALSRRTAWKSRLTSADFKHLGPSSRNA